MIETGNIAPESVLAALHFNIGLREYRAGRLGEAIEALADAVRLEPTKPEYAVVACKASFGAGRLDQANNFLSRANAAGLDEQVSKRLAQAIERATSGPPEQPQVSWTLAFCDWLESMVHDICQELRASVAERGDRRSL